MVERVNVGGSPDPALSTKQADHDAAMAKAADGGVSSISSVNKQTGEAVNLSSTTTEVKAERPAEIPEKFWDAEKGEVNVAALLKAQQDAEAALRQTQQKPQTEEKPEGAEAPKVEAGQQSAVDAAAAEFAEKGELSEDTFATLEKVGLSRQMVETYIEGQRAIVSNLQSAAYSAFDGTAESYQSAIKWAADNLSDEEIAALDVQLTSLNPAIVKQGAKALAARYAQEADIVPTRQVLGEGSGPTGSYFKSSHEMMKAMSDPRYAQDAAFRDEVAMKIDRAVKAGVKLYN